MTAMVSELTAEQHFLVYLEQKEKKQHARREVRCEETKARRNTKSARKLLNNGSVPLTIGDAKTEDCMRGTAPVRCTCVEEKRILTHRFLFVPACCSEFHDTRRSVTARKNKKEVINQK